MPCVHLVHTSGTWLSQLFHLFPTLALNLAAYLKAFLKFD